MPIILGMRVVLFPLFTSETISTHIIPQFSVQAASEPISQSVQSTLLQPRIIHQPSAMPSITADGVYMFSPETSTVLYEKNANHMFAPASTTKILTALVALNHYNLNEVITIDNIQSAIGQSTNFVNGEQLTVRDLLYAALVHSGNDAAYLLANHFDGGYAEFVNELNRTATALHASSSHFSNVSGVQSPGHFTTPKDLAEITRVALNNPQFRQIVETKSITIQDQRGWYRHDLINLNQLLFTTPGVYGVKTGWTPEAGECLVTAVKRDDRNIILVVLRSQDRFGDSTKLIDWAFANYEWLPL